jgi:hypothetical protein
MSCRRARRELQWLVQFGEFDQESAPHLDHLAGCRACREEIGIDRALVRQLRTALAARIEDTAPSPTAWDGVLARMRQPEPRRGGFRPWAARLAAGLRAGTAMAGAGLALVLALNLDIVPMAPTPTPDTGAQTGSRPDWAGDIPPFVVVAPPAAPIEATAVEPSEEDTSVMLRPAAQAEQLPLGRAEAATSSSVERDSQPADRPDEIAEVSGWQVRLVPSDAARIAGPDAEPHAEPEPVPAPPLQGPS